MFQNHSEISWNVREPFWSIPKFSGTFRNHSRTIPEPFRYHSRTFQTVLHQRMGSKHSGTIPEPFQNILEQSERILEAFSLNLWANPTSPLGLGGLEWGVCFSTPLLSTLLVSTLFNHYSLLITTPPQASGPPIRPVSDHPHLHFQKCTFS